MTKILLLSFLLLLASVQLTYAQKDHLSSQKGKTTLGIGLGLPYGGIGFNVGNNISKGLNLFGGIGYQLAGVGYNFGLIKSFPTNVQTEFYLAGMYGTNAVIVVDGASEFDKLYTGASFGLGVKINSVKTEGNFWNLGLLVPIRSQEFKDDEEALRNNPDIILQDILPFTIVVGYNFTL